MAELAFEGNDKIEVSDYELAQPGISYTINTLEHLKEIYPANELFSYAEQILFWKWKSGGWEKISLRIFLLQSASGPVTDRKNYAGRFQNMKENMQPIIRINAQMPPISSTAVRERLRQEKQ